MIEVLTMLEALLTKRTSYYYQVRNHYRGHKETYDIDLFLTLRDRIVISSSLYDDIIEVWTNKHPSEEDGVRISKDALLEYLLYIIKAEFND